jgi:hypothetical protein
MRYLKKTNELLSDGRVDRSPGLRKCAPVSQENLARRAERVTEEP